MIYLFGMSHILPILGACSATADGILHRIANEHEPAFVPWETRPGLFSAPLQAANLFGEYRMAHWGPTIAYREKDLLHIAPGFLKLLNSIDDAHGTLFASINGVELLKAAIAEPATPFDFYLPWREDLGVLPGRQIIPFEVIRRQMLALLTETLSIFIAMRQALPNMRIVNIAHPPAASEAQVQRNPKFLNLNFPDRPAQPLSIRLKYYWLYAQLMETALHNLGIGMLMAPPAALDEHGALADSHAADIIHGNRAYGALVCAQMDAVHTKGAR